MNSPCHEFESTLPELILNNRNTNGLSHAPRINKFDGGQGHISSSFNSYNVPLRHLPVIAGNVKCLYRHGMSSQNKSFPKHPNYSFRTSGYAQGEVYIKLCSDNRFRDGSFPKKSNQAWTLLRYNFERVLKPISV